MDSSNKAYCSLSVNAHDSDNKVCLFRCVTKHEKLSDKARSVSLRVNAHSLSDKPHYCEQLRSCHRCRIYMKTTKQKVR